MFRKCMLCKKSKRIKGAVLCKGCYASIAGAAAQIVKEGK